MAVLVKALGYYSHKGGKSAQGLSKLKAHLKYLEHGKVHENEPRGFDSEREMVGRGEFLEQVQKQPERGVIAHKLVFSMSQDEQDRLGINLRQLVRATMDDWSRRLGRPLNWVGFEHIDKGHPHVHVVVAGYAGEKQVGLYERDLRHLRGDAEREKERQGRLHRAMPEREGREHSLGNETHMDRNLEQVRSRFDQSRGR